MTHVLTPTVPHTFRHWGSGATRNGTSAAYLLKSHPGTTKATD
jgi:hypothetical protein